jgi:hypothetical protein
MKIGSIPSDLEISAGRVVGVNQAGTAFTPMATLPPSPHNHDGVYATPADIAAAIASLLNSAPGALDTLNEIAVALGNDPNFAATITNALAGKAAVGHNHDATYEPKNLNIQAHVSSAHAPANAQKNSDITKAEIEAKLVGEIATHTHPSGAISDPNPQAYAPGSFTLANDKYAILAKRLTMTGSQRATLQGTSQLRVL